MATSSSSSVSQTSSSSASFSTSSSPASGSVSATIETSSIASSTSIASTSSATIDSISLTSTISSSATSSASTSSSISQSSSESSSASSISSSLSLSSTSSVTSSTVSLTAAPTLFLVESSATPTSTSSSKPARSRTSTSSTSLSSTLSPTPSVTLTVLPTTSTSTLEPIPSSTENNTPPDADPNAGGNTGAANRNGALKSQRAAKVAAGAVGGIFGAALLILAIILLMRCRRRKITNRRTANMRTIERSGNGDSFYSGDLTKSDLEAMGAVNEKARFAGADGVNVDPPHLSVGLGNDLSGWTFNNYRTATPTGSLFSGIMPPPPPVAPQMQYEATRDSTVPPSYTTTSPDTAAPLVADWGKQLNPVEDASAPHGTQVGSPVLPEIMVISPTEQGQSPQNNEPLFERMIPSSAVANQPISLMTSVEPASPTQLAYAAITTPTNLHALDTHTPNSMQSAFSMNTTSNPFRKSTQTLWSQASEESRYSVPSPATGSSLYQQYNSPPVPPIPAHMQNSWTSSNGMLGSPMFTPSLASANFPQLVTPVAASGHSMRASVVTMGSRFSIGESPIEPPPKRRLW